MDHEKNRTRQTVLLVILTGIYLAAELGFNARLLDVVGSGASIEEIKRIENWGRFLSGIAVGLFVLQYVLGKVNEGRMSPFACILMPAASVILTFFLIKTAVDMYVDRQPAEFRQTSTYLVMLQRALIANEALIEGMNEQEDLSTSPQGRTFLALFPLMASAVDGLDEKTAALRLELVRRVVSSSVGGIQSYYDSYRQAVTEVKEKYNAYLAAQTPKAIEEAAEKEADKAWKEYIEGLRKRNLDPLNLNRYQRKMVVYEVRKQVKVPADWQPYDFLTFKAAVKTQARSEMREGFSIDGRYLKAGMDFQQFVAQPAVQEKLRDTLRLPPIVTVKSSYATAEEFRSNVFAPMVDLATKRELRKLTDSPATFEKGRYNHDIGLKATQTVLIPPIALLLSLMGAITHLGKLVYMLLKIAAPAVPVLQRRPWMILAAPVVIAASSWAALSVMQNQITQSSAYMYMLQQIQSSRDTGSTILSNAVHVVSVGQSFLYPFNERIRKTMLLGATFGYNPERKGHTQ